MTDVIRILGVDPGSRATGWGIIECAGSRLSFVEAGVVRPAASLDRAAKLAVIFDGLRDVLTRLAPAEAAVEATFVNASPRDALVLGEARGIALLAPSVSGLPVAEYAANSIKKSVVGRGHAGKEQVQAMIKVLLPGAGAQPADAADALAVAICHAHNRALNSLKSIRRSA
ncbi:MAG: crossover junction endodeoxyribonuclease RuvC [Pseudomonadota bacterium]